MRTLPTSGVDGEHRVCCSKNSQPSTQHAERSRDDDRPGGQSATRESPETAKSPLAPCKGRGRFPTHEEERLCLPSGSVGSILGKATSTTDYWNTVKQTNKQASKQADGQSPPYPGYPRTQGPKYATRHPRSDIRFFKPFYKVV